MATACFGIGFWLILGFSAGDDRSAAVVDFGRDVRPILTTHCVGCHGPEKRKGGLRLDRKAEALTGGDSGPAIEPGHADDSLLIANIADPKSDTPMPPKGQGRRLTPDEVETLRRWIDQGATWSENLASTADRPEVPTHWSFRPIARPEPPTVGNAPWVRNPIDAFVLAALEAKGWTPSPEADRPTLLRRLSLDLLGLPPTPRELRAFLEDQSPGAYERLVDRLLASPHFGERWGRHWLDLARYADSDGYEKDLPRPYAWRYRDWVIDAFNRDLPFDRFTIEQLAGDLLPDATLETRTATGFHRNTLTNREGGVDQEEYRLAAVIDRTNTTGSVWLGLTVGCAQCHTHKYDPITHREYYKLFAFFNAAREADIPAPSPAETEDYARNKVAHDAELARLTAAVDRDESEGRPGRQQAWEQAVRPATTTWVVLDPKTVQVTGGATATPQPDRSVVIASAAKGKDEESVALPFQTQLCGVTSFRIEALGTPDEVFRLAEVKIDAILEETGPDPKAMNLLEPLADQGDKTVARVLDGKPRTTWDATIPESGRRVAVIQTDSDGCFCKGGTLTVRLSAPRGGLPRRFRLSATIDDPPSEADPLPDDVAAALAIVPDRRTQTQRDAIAAYHRTVDARSVELRRAVRLHKAKAPQPPETKAQTLQVDPKGRKTHILTRGDFLRPGAEVTPGVPSILTAFGTDEPFKDRLALARWLVDPKNPLTARVQVNRTWAHLFGRGLAASLDDFGTRGERPSHPELLDWLASEFVRQGWSRKALIRAIVTSATYRQDSRHRSELAEADPNNVFLGRQARLRLEAETIRDVALTVSGLLNPTIGGPSIRPPLPADVAALGYAGSVKWSESTGRDRYRRGMYVFFQRTVPYPMLMTFDAPDSNVACLRRERSNTPLQALTLWNDPVFVECAQALGRSLASEPGDDRDRIILAWRRCFGRDPHPAERDRASTFLAQALAETKGDAASAWTALARVLLNLDEFITRD